MFLFRNLKAFDTLKIKKKYLEVLSKLVHDSTNKNFFVDCLIQLFILLTLHLSLNIDK